MENYNPTWNKFSLSFIKKGIKYILLHISRQFFIPPLLRPIILTFCGIEFKNKKNVFIGSDVLFDCLKDTKTVIGNNVYITTGAKLINHYPIISKEGVTEFKRGNILIEDNVFIGMNSLIIKPVTIGKGAIVGAGSIVTKDIPQGAIVGGNPARIISYTTKNN